MSCPVRADKLRKLILCLLALILLNACVQPEQLVIEPVGFIECFRLDREPIAENLPAECTNQQYDPRVGNMHRNPEKSMTASVTLRNMEQQRLEKLPLADCLWTAQSRFGNGDLLSMYWEGYFDLVMPDDRRFSMSACRLDPPDARISIQQTQTEEFLQYGLSDFCLDGFAVDSDTVYEFQRPIDLEMLKSNCDINPYPINLKVYPAVVDEYRSCTLNAHDSAAFRLPNPYGNYAPRYPDFELQSIRSSDGGVSACAGVNGEMLTTLRPRGDVTDRHNPADFRLEISHSVNDIEASQFLDPAIMTVVDESAMARPLSEQNIQLRWQGEVTVAGPVGQQRWLENFSENIRVESISVFVESDNNPLARTYIELSSAQLSVIDPDQSGVVIGSCSGNDQQIDMGSCGLDVTPTYNVENLARTDIQSLSAPLIWAITLPEVLPDGQPYIKFNLVSTFKTRQAALQASVQHIDFGAVNIADNNQQLLQFENVGFGDFIIDEVVINSNHGHPLAFSADRLDDPVMMPYLFYLEQESQANTYLAGTQEGFEAQPFFTIHEGEGYERIQLNNLDGMELEIEAEPVGFIGRTAYAMNQSAAFDGSQQIGQRMYPFQYPVYQVWNLPYRVSPGQQRSVMVTTRPYIANHLKGRLDVSGYPAHLPSQRQTVSVFFSVTGNAGPIIELLPSAVSFAHGGQHHSSRRIAVVNAGDASLERGALTIVAADSPYHHGEDVNFSVGTNQSMSNTIGVGSAEIITLEYDPGCFYVMPAAGLHRATLLIETELGVKQVPLSGRPELARDANPQCEPIQ